MTYRVIFDAKKQTVSTTVSFDFTSVLLAGEVINTTSSPPVITATVYSGTDPQPGRLVTQPKEVNGPVVSIQLLNGVVGVTYLLVCKISIGAAPYLKYAYLEGYLTVV